VRTRVIELRELATDITTALTSQLITPKLQQAVDALGAADAVIAAAPVYKAGPSGLFTSFFHVLDNDLLIGKPVVLAATAGTARHALVVDDQMRSLFAYLRTLPVPTALFAAPEDWGDAALNRRIDRAAFELVLLMESGFARSVRDESWQNYQHELGSAGGTETEINIDSDLMRLATGGSASSLGQLVAAGFVEGRADLGLGQRGGAGDGDDGDAVRHQLDLHRGDASERADLAGHRVRAVLAGHAGDLVGGRCHQVPFAQPTRRYVFRGYFRTHPGGVRTARDGRSRPTPP